MIHTFGPLAFAPHVISKWSVLSEPSIAPWHRFRRCGSAVHMSAGAKPPLLPLRDDLLSLDGVTVEWLSYPRPEPEPELHLRDAPMEESLDRVVFPLFCAVLSVASRGGFWPLVACCCAAESLWIRAARACLMLRLGGDLVRRLSRVVWGWGWSCRMEDMPIICM